MKKYFSLVVVLVFFFFSSNAEVIRWKGMELGLPERPKWIRQYLEKSEVQYIRKKFQIDRNSIIIVGIGTANALELGRSLSQTDALHKLQSDYSESKNSFVYITEYWEEDDANVYTVYSIYELIIYGN